MRYNTVRGSLIIQEYGRNVQELINHAKTIEDKAERQSFVERIIVLMHQMHPQSRNVEDYKAKLWSHLLRMADYELDIDVPENTPSKEDYLMRPQQMRYPSGTLRYRHYGKNVQRMIQKAIEMEDPVKRVEYTKVIGSYMKMAYKTWNRETVSDETIKSDLNAISKGELNLEEDAAIQTHGTTRRRKPQNGGGSSNRNYSSKSNGRSSNSYKKGKGDYKSNNKRRK